MGKINEYQRQQLASQVVGSAEPSRAGQIIGQAVGEFGGVIKRQELQRRDESINLQANLALMEFAPALQRDMYNLQRNMSDNPQEFQSKLFEDGMTLIGEFGGGISNDDVRTRFTQNAQNFLRQQVMNAGGWVEAKDQENAEIAAAASTRKAVIAFGQTRSPEELKLEMQNFREFVQEEIPDEITGRIRPEEILKKHMPEALKSHFSNRVLYDADNLIKDLKEGRYDDIPGFTAVDKAKYLKAAETEKRREEARIKRAQVDNFESAFLDMTENRLSFSMIDELATAENPRDGLSHERGHVRRLKTGLLKRVESDASKLETSEPDAAAFIDLVYKVFDKEERVARAEILEQTVDIWRDGIVSPEESRLLSEMSRDFKDIQLRKKWHGYMENLDDIRQWADKVYGKGKVVTPLARMARNFFDRVSAGADMYAVKTQILRHEAIRRALEFNPMLSTYEDPVEQSYRHQAIEALENAGYPIDESNIKAAMEQLKQREDE